MRLASHSTGGIPHQGLENLTLSSYSVTDRSSSRPINPSLQRLSSTDSPPHVQVTPPPSFAGANSTTRTQSSSVDSLNIDGLAINSDTPDPSTPRQTRHLSAEAAESVESSRRARPSPSHSRRRSSSVGPRLPHAVESEQPPETQFFERRTQEALVGARSLTSQLVASLRSSILHQERGSRINELYRQAIELHSFEVHSTRIIGLVGESGVGKSKLINSLLDTKDLAQSVSRSASHEESKAVT